MRRRAAARACCGLFVAAENLFDEIYATRGIYASILLVRGFRDTRAGAALSCRRDLADVNADNGATMPRLTKIYTKTGDDGTTGLGGGQRVPKDALRIETLRDRRRAERAARRGSGAAASNPRSRPS